MRRKIILYIGAATVVFVLIFYCLTLAPGLTFIDSGELAAVCVTSGIAHPTGYPLYTILGWLFTRIPVNARPIYLLNLMSALLAGLSLFLFYLCLCDIFLKAKDASAPPLKKVPEPLVLLSIGSGVLLLAFCRVFWSVALVTEVYALHGFFISLLMLLSLKAFCSGAGNREGRLFWVGALFFILGLSFCNHMSTVLILPGLFYLMVSQKKIWGPDWKKAFFLSLFFISGLSVYLYLPLRASQSPALNWGNPQTWETFFWHVAGKQYRVWMFSSFEAALKQGEYFIQLVLSSFGFFPLLLIPFGIWYLFHLNRPVCWFSVIFFLAGVVYGINYDIKDIDAYFLPAIMMCGLWMSGSLVFFVSIFHARKKLRYKAGIAALGCVFFFPLLYNYSKVDQSNNNHVEQYTQNIFSSIGPNALILSYQWDYFCSPFYYLKLAEGLRQDVAMVEVKLLKRSWYLRQLQKNYPELMRISQPAVARFSRELYKFEHGLPYEPKVIQARYIEMINSFIRKNIPNRPVYITCETEPEIGSEMQRVPEGLVFRLCPPETGYRGFDFSGLTLPSEDDFNKDDRFHTALKSFYAFMLTSRGLYEMRFQNRKPAGQLFHRALEIVPDYPLAKKGLATLQKNL